MWCGKLIRQSLSLSLYIYIYVYIYNMHAIEIQTPLHVALLVLYYGYSGISICQL